MSTKTPKSDKTSKLVSPHSKAQKTESKADTEQDKSLAVAAPIKKTFPIVGVGASAGGLSAYTKLLKALWLYPVSTDT